MEVNILVMGASGLIGGRLVQHLVLQPGTRVRAATRRRCPSPAGVEGIIADVTNAATLEPACDGMDVVINLASAGESASAADPELALRATGGGALALASAAARMRVRRFVQMSTSKVYGNNPVGVVTEAQLPAPASHYSITHRLAEDYVRLQHPDAVILRLSNGFGAPAGSVSGWNIILNEMCRQAVTDRVIVIRSSGLMYRNFIPMHDIVRAVHAASVEIPAGLYNLGSSASMRLRDAAQRIADVCGRALGFVPEVRTGDPAPGEKFLPLDYRIDRLVAAGFSPAASFDEEIEKTLRAAVELQAGRGR